MKHSIMKNVKSYNRLILIPQATSNLFSLSAQTTINYIIQCIYKKFRYALNVVVRWGWSQIFSFRNNHFSIVWKMNNNPIKSHFVMVLITNKSCIVIVKSKKVFLKEFKTSQDLKRLTYYFFFKFWHKKTSLHSYSSSRVKTPL